MLQIGTETETEEEEIEEDKAESYLDRGLPHPELVDKLPLSSALPFSAKCNSRRPLPFPVR